MNKKNFGSYIKTFLYTILGIFIAIFILFGVIQHQVYTETIQKQVEDNTIDYYLIGVLIDKNKYLLQKDPTNYKLHLRLAILYEIKKDYPNAEFEYKQALANAPYDEFRTQYRFALYYIKAGRLADAENMIESVEERPNKDLIRCKGEVYNRLGDKYYAKGDYEDAGEEYQKALFYFSKIDAGQAKAIKASIASSYVYLADEKVGKMQIQDAIDDLQTALGIVDAPIIKYKLALLFMKDNPDLSCKYFEEVFHKEPSIIDYDTYYNFLSEIASQADLDGYTAKAELYRYRIKKLKEYYSRNILSVQDLGVEAESGKIKLNGWSKKYNIRLEFRLKNISEYKIDSLFIDVIFKDGDTVIDEYTKQIVDKDSTLKAFAYSPIISLDSHENQTGSDIFPKTITAEIYATKTETSYRILLKKITLVERTKTKTQNTSFFNLNFGQPSPR